MNRLARVVRSIGALFFDDGRLALGILLLLACTAAVARVDGSASRVTITLLVGGTLLLLVRSVLRAAPSR